MEKDEVAVLRQIFLLGKIVVEISGHNKGNFYLTRLGWGESGKEFYCFHLNSNRPQAILGFPSHYSSLHIPDSFGVFFSLYIQNKIRQV